MIDESIIKKKPFSWFDIVLLCAALIIISLSVLALDWSFQFTSEVVRNASSVPLPPLPSAPELL